MRDGGRWLWGLLLIGLGAVWTLNNLGLASLDLGDVISRFWPILFVIAGLSGFSRSLGRSFQVASMLLNLFLIALGLLLIAENEHMLPPHVDVWGLLFPAFLILGGISLLFRQKRPMAAHAPALGRSHFVMMSGTRLQAPAGPMEDLSVTAIMGGPTIDLTAAWPTGERETVIDLFLLMGGANIYLPQEVTVVCEGTAIMGGVDLMGREHGGLIGSVDDRVGTGPVVRIRVHTIMGGAKIRQR